MILDNLDEIYQEVLEELSYRVGIVNLQNKNHVDILSEILDTTELAQYKSDILSELYKNVIAELDFQDKDAFADYKSQHKMRSDTPVTIAGKKTTVGAASNTSKEKEKEEPKSNSKKRIINGKDKTLSTENPLKTQEYQKELEPNDDTFAVKNKKFENPTPPPPYKLPDSIIQNPKFPKRYLKLFERFMNTQPIGSAKSLSHFSNFQGGAGKLPAQAGELMTMMAVTMGDDEFKEFETSVSAHIEELQKLPDGKFKKDGSRIVNKTWLKSAANNRKAILKKVNKQFPGYKIAATSWDAKDEVEALGMNGYANKGFSTDIYLRLENENKEPLLVEISLKQNLKVNLLNSGTGKFFEWLGKDNVPDNINPQKFAANERKKLSKFCETNAAAIRELADTDVGLKRVIEEKGIDFDTALSLALKGKGKQRDILKVLFEATKALQRQGNENATNLIDEMDNDHATYVAEAIKAVTTNPTLKEGMLNEIKNEFPLKSVADNEESIVLGEYTLDKSTMEVIFGTSDFDEFKQGLISEPGPPPFIAYKVKVGGRIIPIADIEVREDGRNYGGAFKFEMKVNDEFSKEIIKANREIYP